MYIKSARFYTGKIKKRFFSLEERYSLYFGMLGHEYGSSRNLGVSRNLGDTMPIHP